MFHVNYNKPEAGGLRVTYGAYALQYEAVFVASQLAKCGHVASVEGPGGVATTFFPRPSHYRPACMH